MGGYCLPKEKAQAFKKALKDRVIDPAKLVDMTSEERRTFLGDIVGKDHANDVNRLFESKLLLKTVQQGMVTWAKTVGGMKPEVRRDLISRIEKLDERILNPTEEKLFLQDLAAQKLGVNVTMDEVKTINDLAQKVKDTEQYKGSPDLDKRLEYGKAVTDLSNYVGERKLASRPTVMETLRTRPTDLPMKALRGVAGNMKAIKASMDNSAIFRQGWKTLWTHPTIWAKNSLKSFDNLFTYRNQHAVLDALNADIVSRPTYDLMRKAKLDVGVQEEVFPTTLPEKIPGLGRVYKATENAYTAFVRKTRADVFDKYIEIAKNKGVELNDTELQSIGKMVNSLTGRGNLGKLEGAGSLVNTFFFSPKMLKSQFDILTQPLTGAGGSSFVRRQAAINLIKIAAGTAGIMAIAKMLKPDSVELDPRSSDFGKIKIDNTRFDVTGGAGSVLVLLARLSMATAKVAGADVMSFKSSTTGKLSDLTEPGFGKQNTVDVITNFFENKAAPFWGMLRDFYRGETFEGKKPTVAGEALSAITPLPFDTIKDLLQDPKAQKDPRFVAFATVADMLGISTSTQKPRPKGKNKPPDLDLEPLLKMFHEYIDAPVKK